MKRLLFICSRNRLRSPTAQEIFVSAEIETDSAGLAPDADCPLSAEQIEWADMIFVMERHHLSKLRREFGDRVKGKKVVCLDIADKYKFMQPELVALLESRVKRFLV